MNFVVRHKKEDLVNSISDRRNTRVNVTNKIFVSAQVALKKIGKKKIDYSFREIR